MLEREHELSQAAVLVEAAAPGAQLTLGLLGPAGAGKTTVLDALGHQVRRAGATVWRADAEELETASPYAVLRQLFSRPVAALPDDRLRTLTEGPAALALDLVRDRAGTPAAEAGGSAEQPGALVDAARVAHSLYWLCVSVLTGPVVLVVDDAQWADQASMQALASLAARAEDLPLSFLLAAREALPGNRPPGLSLVLGTPNARVLRLHPLTAGAVAELVAGAAGAPVSPEFAEVCHDLTGGNPFLVGELADLVALAGVPTDPSGVGAVRTLVPTGVVDVVLRRLVGLGAGAAALLRAAAVLEQAPLRLVAQTAGLTPEDAAEAADQLREQGLLAPDEPVRLRHGLLLGAVLESVGAARLSLLRRRAAGVLCTEGHDPARAAAQLLRCDGAGEEWVVDCLVEAALAALEAGAPHEAERLLARAVQEPPAPERRGEVLFWLGSARLRCGSPASVDTLVGALATLGDPELRARAALTLAMAFNFGGAYEASVQTLQRALDDLVAGSELALVVEAGLVQAALQIPGMVDVARARLDAHGSLAGTSPGERQLLGHRAAVANATSRPTGVAVEAARAAIGAGEDHPETHEWSLVRLQLAAAGQYEETLAECQRGLEVVRRTGSTMGFVAVSFVGGFARLWAGDLPGAEADFRACIETVEQLDGGQIALTIARAGLVEVLVAAGRTTEATATVDLAAPVDESSFNGAINLLRARGMLRLDLGDAAGALVDLAECSRRLATIEVDNPPWCAWRVLAVEAHWVLGERERAEELLAEDLAQARARQDPVQLGVGLRWRGLLGGLPGQDAVAVLAESVTLLESTGSALETVRSQAALGAALRREGQRSLARDALMLARAGALRLGAAGLVNTVEAELAANGSRPRRTEVSGLGALTASERRVCELAAAGLRNREIAQQLFVSPKTVEVHLSRSFRKLGLPGRDGLAPLLAPAEK